MDNLYHEHLNYEDPKCPECKQQNLASKSLGSWRKKLGGRKYSYTCKCGHKWSVVRPEEEKTFG
jgi:transposase-like protein